MFATAMTLLLCAAPVGSVASERTDSKDGADGSSSLIFMTEHRPPNNYVDAETGRIVGSSTLILRAALDKIGLNASFKLEPWSRSYATAITQPHTCVYSTVRTEQREALFKWVGPLDRTYFFIIARKGRSITLDTIEDARSYRIGVLTQDVRESELRARGGFDIDSVAIDQLNAQKLLSDRIDLWFTDLETLERIEDERRAQLEVVLRLPPRPLYLACNLDVPDETIAAMNTALAELGATAAPVSPPAR